MVFARIASDPSYHGAHCSILSCRGRRIGLTWFELWQGMRFQHDRCAVSCAATTLRFDLQNLDVESQVVIVPTKYSIMLFFLNRSDGLPGAPSQF